MKWIQENMLDEPFGVRSYGRTELARLYHPTLTAKAAWRCMREEINATKALKVALEEAGYDGKRRHFTPRQVELIVETLGQP